MTRVMSGSRSAPGPARPKRVRRGAQRAVLALGGGEGAARGAQRDDRGGGGGAGVEGDGPLPAAPAAEARGAPRVQQRLYI
eukprot:scaffold7966_cov51-Phaeocystis_antarctica.AAC.2